MSARHWLLFDNSDSTFCGRSERQVALATPDKERVTCQTCRKLMILHDHIEAPCKVGSK